MTALERNRRDAAAVRQLARGESWERVAARFGLSRVQLWRRVKDRLGEIRPGSRHLGAKAVS